MKNHFYSTYSRHLVLTFAAISLVACGKGFDAVVEDATGSDSLKLGVITSPATGEQLTSQKAWDQVTTATNGEIVGGTNSGALAIQVDRERQAIILYIPLPPIFTLPVSISGMQIPQMPGATVEIMPQADGSNKMGVVIPLKYLMKGGQFGTYGKLPNGDPIPFIPAAEASGFVIDFPQKAKYRLHVYVATSAAAVFVETPDWKLSDELSFIPTIGFPVKNMSKTQINGYFAVVPNRGSSSAGVYVASRIPTQVAVLIDELIRF